MSKILITGVSGFVGSYLAELLLLQKNVELYGSYLSEASLKNIAHIQEKIQLIQLDLQDKKKVEEVIASIQPDYIFHLAALSSPGDSFDNGEEVIVNNIVTEIHVLDAVRQKNLTKCKILIVSSGDVYGIASKKNVPMDENTEFMPGNPYAVSKIAQDFVALQYFLSYKMNIVRVRPFNHIGPRQSPSFVVASFAKKIAEIEKGHEPIITVGNLESKRDFTDVRDVVRAYSLVIDKGIVGDVYNIGSGVSYTIKEILEKLLSLTTHTITIQKDLSLYRPSDSLDKICNNAKVKKITGWTPKISLEDSLKDTLDYWRHIV